MGDYIRWAPPYYGEDADQELGTRSSLYLALNRGKRSVRLDLKSERGREALLRLVESHDVVIDGFRPGVLERLGVGYEAMREANSGDRRLRDHRLRAGRAQHRARRPRHELPRARRPARADRRQGRPAGAVGRPDRRHRRRRPDGGGRHPRRPARAPALRRGPVRRRLDGRRRPLLAGAGRRPLLLRRRGAAPRRAAARRRPRLLHALRGGRRLGHLRRPRAEVLGGLLRGRRAPRPGRAPVRPARLGWLARGGRGLQGAHAGPSGRRSTTSTTAASSRSSTSTRRSTRSWSGPARW